MEQPKPHYPDDELAIDLREYGRILWRWKWLLVLCAVLAGAAAFLVNRSLPPVFASSTTLLIHEAPDAQTSDYTALLMSERLTQTYSEMLRQRPVLEEVIEQLELDSTVEDLQEAVEVQPVRNTQLVLVTVEHANPFTAAQIANTLVLVFQRRNEQLQQSRFAESKASLEAQLERLNAQIEETEAAIAAIGEPTRAEEESRLQHLQTDLAQYQSSYSTLLQSYEALRLAEASSVSNVVQVEPAEADLEPVRPRPLMNTALAIAVGLMLALGGIFLIEYLDDSVKSPEQVERHLRLPVLGTISSLPETSPGEPFVAAQPRAPASEAFRALRTNIQYAAVDRDLRTLLVTSPGPQEGKSTVGANLAAVMAQGGRSILLLEADLRRPRVHQLLGLPGRSPGLSDLFVREPFSLDGTLRSTGVKDLQVMASGELPPNPAELLGSERMLQILESLKKEADVVIIDASPVTVVTDPVVLSSRVDGVLLVVEPGKTELGAAEHAVASLRRAKANLIGVVFNNVPVNRAAYYGAYRYQYSYSYRSEES